MTSLPGTIFEAETAYGLSNIAKDEITRIFGNSCKILNEGPTHVRFRYLDSAQNLKQLRSVVSVYAYLLFQVPRPRALLGHEHFSRICTTIDQIIAMQPEKYNTFNISAAGSNSSVMQRIKSALSEATNLENDERGGDLLLRIRRNRPNWEVLIRLTPRPLSARSWRICDYEGALNAPVAYAISQMSYPVTGQSVLNICCGSASLIIERLSINKCQITGVDISTAALTCAEENLKAADKRNDVVLLQADAANLPLIDRSYDTVLADLPFGQRVGSHVENTRLYPAILDETARITRGGATFGLITHEIKLITNLLHENNEWKLEREQRISLRGLHPRIYVLRRL